MRPLTWAGFPPSWHEAEYCPRSPCHSIFQSLQPLFSSRERKPFTGDIGSAISAAVMQKRPIRFAAMPPERVNSHVPGCIGLESAHTGSAADSASSMSAADRIGTSDDHHVHELVDRCRGQLFWIGAQREDRLLLLDREAPCQVGLEFLYQ